MNNVCHRIVCVVLSVIILSLSFSAFAVDEPLPTETPYPGTEDNPTMQANDQTVAFLVYTLLKSWGIEIQYDDISGYTTNVQQKITNWIWEYLDEQPSVESIVAWCADWYFQTDFWGNLVVNQTLLQDVEAFAGWLEDLLGLENNEHHALDPLYALDNLTLYEFNTFYSAVRADTEQLGMYLEISADELNDNPVSGLWYFVALIGNKYKFQVIGTREAELTIQTHGMLANGTVEYRSIGSVLLSSDDLNVNGIYASASDGFNPPSGRGDEAGIKFIPADAVVGVFADREQLQSFLDNAQIVTSSDGAVVTTEINLPVDDPTYTVGDSMTIIDDDPSYSIVEWPSEVTVSNLPAVITPVTIQEPDLNSAYQEITPFFRTMEGGLDIVRGLVLRMPVEVLSCLFALMGAMVIFGILKIMREH